MLSLLFLLRLLVFCLSGFWRSFLLLLNVFRLITLCFFLLSCGVFSLVAFQLFLYGRLFAVGLGSTLISVRILFAWVLPWLRAFVGLGCVGVFVGIFLFFGRLLLYNLLCMAVQFCDLKWCTARNGSINHRTTIQSGANGDRYLIKIGFSKGKRG